MPVSNDVVDSTYRKKKFVEDCEFDDMISFSETRVEYCDAQELKDKLANG